MSKDGRPWALVTGAGAGIGRAIALRLGLEGMAVAALDRNAEAARQTALLLREAGGEAQDLALDLTDGPAVQRAVEALPPLSALVNNAGIFDIKPFLDLTPDDFRRMHEVNLVTLFAVSRAAAPRMPRGGAIVNIASRAWLGAKPYAHYVASKAAVVGLTRAMAIELAPLGLRVNAVAPGVIETDMLKAWTPEQKASLAAQHPLGSLGAPEDIANAVAFLATGQSRFITGHVLLVDGGRSLGGVTGP